ncbi:MAG: 3-dehydroquinate synthase [Coriobacteriaceae bacterium]|nr:3-dehydroquinate synthase [Coriobacteriaceae bacterium]
MSSARTIVRVELGERGYDVRIGRGVLAELGSGLRALTKAARVALVADERVWGLYGERVFSSLLSAGFRVSPVTVPAGEGSKSWDRAGDVLERLATAGISRDDVVVALGGGVTGDLAGFCAAVYMRGIPFVQAPTTLLAQVDSSIGGKTGVDLAAGKNLAGAFWQPLAVFADTSVLQTLSDEEWSSGLAEVAKCALLAGGESYTWLKDNAERLRAREPDCAPGAVSRAAAFKAGVVAADEREFGTRECLNYGHTFGHALERAAGYGSISHGAAVVEGMRFAAAVAEDVLGVDPGVRAAQEALFEGLGLVRPPLRADPAEISRAMRRDKKVRGGALRFVLLKAPGVWEVATVDEAVVEKRSAEWSDRAGRG